MDVSDDVLIQTIQRTVGEKTAEKAKGVLDTLQRYEENSQLDSKSLIKLSRQMEEVREEIDKWKANR